MRGVKVKCKWRGVSIEQATWEELSVVQRLSAKYEQFRFTRRLDQLIKQELPPLALVEALRKERLLPSV